MNIDFNAALEAGMSREDLMKIVQDAVSDVMNDFEKQKAAKDAAAQKKIDEKEALKAEARAYAVNALICYAEAFDLLDEGEEFSAEEIAEMEAMLIKFEKMIPVYLNLLKLSEDDDAEADGLFGLFGGGLG